MRSINVSTDVFAKIWSLREESEETEDAILRRLLKCNIASPELKRPNNDGVTIDRFRVHFAEGFQIFRTFKGTEYRAQANQGRWLLENTGARYSTLADLSRAIGAGIENVWVNWYFTTTDGKKRPISDLRDPATISHRRASY